MNISCTSSICTCREITWINVPIVVEQLKGHAHCIFSDQVGFFLFKHVNQNSIIISTNNFLNRHVYTIPQLDLASKQCDTKFNIN